jgi:hypothetical protein
MSAARLMRGADGTVLVLPDNMPPDQLVQLRAHRDVILPIVQAYGAAEIFIRPAGAEPLPQWPTLTPQQLKHRRKWLARDTARFGLVNRELPR